MRDDLAPASGGKPLVTPTAIIVVITPAVLFTLAFVFLCQLKYDYVSVLWQRQTGIKMLVTSGILFLTGEAILALLMFVDGWMRGRSGRRFVLYTILVLDFVLFLGPAAFVLFLGPAAIQITDTMLAQ